MNIFFSKEKKPKNCLYVQVVEGRKFLSQDEKHLGSGKSNYYCSVDLVNNKGIKMDKRQMTRKARDVATGENILHDIAVSPVWGDTLEFPYRDFGGIEILVWDSYLLKRDVLLGGIILRFNRVGLQARKTAYSGWFELADLTNHELAGEVYLKIWYGRNDLYSSSKRKKRDVVPEIPRVYKFEEKSAAELTVADIPVLLDEYRAVLVENYKLRKQFDTPARNLGHFSGSLSRSSSISSLKSRDAKERSASPSSSERSMSPTEQAASPLIDPISYDSAPATPIASPKGPPSESLI